MGKFVVGFVADKNQLTRKEWQDTRHFHLRHAHKMCIGGFETSPCRWCGELAKVTITFLGDDSDMLYTSCASCGEVLREWAVYETDVKNDTNN